MKVKELIELLRTKNPEATAVIRVEDRYVLVDEAFECAVVMDKHGYMQDQMISDLIEARSRLDVVVIS